MRQVLLAGGAGYLGGAVLSLLERAGYEVTVLDSLLHSDAYLRRGRFLRGDVRDRATLAKALEGVDAVVWLAAIVGDPACHREPERAILVNQEAVRVLAELWPGRVVFTSTCSVYGEGLGAGVLGEEATCRPVSLYAVTKLGAEAYLARTRATILRLGTLYGASDPQARIRFDLVVNGMAARAVAEGRITVLGGSQKRPITHVRDVAQAILLALERDVLGTFNVASQNVTVAEIGAAVAEEVPGVDVEVVQKDFADPRSYWVSSERFRAAVPWSPRFDLREGVREVATLVREGRIRDWKAPRWTNTEAAGG